jgi:hypothetical protein
LITDDEQFTIQETDQVQFPEADNQYLEDMSWPGLWEPERERLIALLLDYKKEFKPERKIPAIRFKVILRDS